MTKDNKVMSTKSRTDYEANNAIIRDAFITVLKKNKGLRPSIDELTEETGLHSNTIKKHLKALDFRDLMKENACWKLLTDDVILAIYRSAMKGNTGSQKLWLQVVEGSSEKTETQHSGQIVVDNKPPVILRIG